MWWGLWHGFHLGAKRGLLVGGGMGLAPLHFLAQADPDHKMEVIVGGRTRAEVFWRTCSRTRLPDSMKPPMTAPTG